MTKEQWLEKRRSELLPCGYFHVVFTVPHILNPLILANRKELLTLLFKAVRGTVFAFAADSQWRLQGKPGLLTILHTWSQTLIDHFHIHCLIPAGVLSFDGRRWVESRENFLFRTTSLAKEFKKQYLNLLEQNKEFLETEKAFEGRLEKSRRKNWVVYAKKPFAGPEQVLSYLGRYTHRIAISNHRIKSIENNTVVFSYRDRSDNGKTKTMKLPTMEFIRRFLLHVLPKRFMKIRYYGFLANVCKRKAVLLIRRLIGKYIEVFPMPKETLRKKVLRLTGRDILLCPHCRKGNMITIGFLFHDTS
jgi:hypothetical protein